MKNVLQNIVVFILGWQTKRLYDKNKFQVIAVAGSYGKTSTKLAIAKALENKYKVCWQDGNYNHLATVPLIFFGQNTPSLFNPFAWLGVFVKNELVLAKKYPYQIVVVELGVDGPNQMRRFKKYLKVDLGIVTSIAPEHMEFFDSLAAVTEEELDIQQFSKTVLVNKNLSPAKLPSSSKAIGYRVEFDEDNLTEQWAVKLDSKTISPGIKPDSTAQLYTFANTAVVCDQLGMGNEEIRNALLKTDDVPGRMNRLEGKNGSTIIDDTYNASPDATIMSLKNLYAEHATARIALLGNMNELGGGSEKYHRKVGKFCDPEQLDLVVTLGPDANEYLAEEAKKRGCNVIETSTPYEAAEKIERHLDKNVAVLAKGSQNGVFAEEAVKQLLADPHDAGMLVRQSPAWLRKKQKNFETK